MLRNVSMRVCMLHNTCTLCFTKTQLYIMLPKPYNPADAAQVSPTQNPNVVHHTHVHNYIIRLIYWWLHSVQTHADAQP